MLQAGYAIVYEGAGAHYDPFGKDKFLALEAAAKKSKRGMWASKTVLESPTEYKRRHATLAEKGSSSSTIATAPVSIWRRLWPF